MLQKWAGKWRKFWKIFKKSIPRAAAVQKKLFFISREVRISHPIILSKFWFIFTKKIFLRTNSNLIFFIFSKPSLIFFIPSFSEYWNSLLTKIGKYKQPKNLFFWICNLKWFCPSQRKSFSNDGRCRNSNKTHQNTQILVKWC